MDARSWGVRVVAVGAVAQAVGIGIDAWLHSSDPELAAREGLFTFSNAGHAFLIGGLVLVAVGALLALVGPFLWGPNAGHLSARGLRAVRIAAPVSVVASVVLGFTLAAGSTLAEGHAHDETETEAAGGVAAEHSHDETETARAEPAAETEAAAVGGVAAPAEHGHGVATPEQPLDAATREELAAQLVAARDIAMRHPTVADAEAAGYSMVTGYVPLIGAHYINWGTMDGTFDIAVPEMLLYDGTDPDSRIVGLSYWKLNEGEPTGFAGPNDHWHQHDGLCLRDRVVIAGESSTEAECAAMGGAKVSAGNAWMVHAWVVPGWESPQGVFSPEHPGLV